MAQGDKKTEGGIGKEDEHAKRTSEVPRSYLRESFGPREKREIESPFGSSRRESQTTQPGMPKDQKKIVTKSGLAPPPASSPISEKQTNPGLTAPPPLDDMQYELDGAAGADALACDEGRVALREEMTPREGTDLNGPDDQSNDRSRFKTAPGGGRNRVSGGRERAAAYVSPTTVSPGHGKDHITSAIKVDEVVANAVRAYETEPSLLRRRASSLPPRMPREHDRTSVLVWAALLVGLLLGGLVVWLGTAASDDESVPVQQPVSADSAPQANPNAGSKESPSATADSDRPPPASKSPSTEAASGSPAPQVVPKAKPVEAPRPSVTPAARPTPKPAAQPTTKKPSDDLWLE